MKESEFKSLGTTKQLQYINNLEALNVQKTEMIRELENPWISVGDRLPPKLAAGQYKKYLVCRNNCVFEANWLFGKFCKRMDGCSDVNPQYWRIIPKPPTERT